MKITEIKWKPGFPTRGVPANMAYQRLEVIKVNNGGDLTADKVVSDAKETDSPLHTMFEWDDSAAAEAYRISQAKEVIRSLQIVFEDGPKGGVRTYEIVHTGTENRKPVNVFRSIEDVLEDPRARAELLGRAFREADAFKNRYQLLQELAGVIGAINSLEVVAV